MERQRCAHCRNPIRGGNGVLQPGAAGDSWFHPDCWAEFLPARQKEYQQSIERLGLAALIAPYVLAPPETATESSGDELPMLVESVGM